MCPPDIPAVASGQARIGPARQMPPAEFRPMQRRTTLGRLASKMRPTNRRSPASVTTRARRSSQRRRSPRFGPAFNTSPFWDFTKAAVRWLGRAGWKPLVRVGIRVGIEGTVGGPVGDFLLAAEAAYWAYKAYPYIKSYFDPPKTLQELRKNEKPGYDDHHIVEPWSKKDGVPESKIESPDNIFPSRS